MIHAFEFFDALEKESKYYLLDVESGAVHLLDEDAYEVARALETGRDPYDAVKCSETVEEVLVEFQELKSLGLYEAPEICAPENAQTQQVIKSMCLHVAHDCNLRCKYCFAGTGEFHGARMLMPLYVGKAALDYLIAHAGKRHNLEVDLFGGEPLMNLDVVKSIVAYGRELEALHDKKIHFTITTNGLALDEDTAAFINAEMHNVVLSLDGRREVHDAMRPTINGKGSYDAILPRLQSFVRLRGDKEYYVRGTFTNRNLDFTEDVRALRDAGFQQISLEPVVLPEDSEFAIGESHIPKVLAEYEKLAAFMMASEAEGKWFNFFHFMLDMDGGPCLQKRVKGCGAGVEYVAVSPEGNIYPCHQFVGEEEFCIGHVLDNICETRIREEFEQCTIRTKPNCKACWAKYYCSGGCAYNAWRYGGGLLETEKNSCAFLQKRTECALGMAMKQKTGERGHG